VPDAIHLNHLRRALELAKANAVSGRGGPFGAVVARGAEIVAEGVNLVTSTHDPTAHAEVNAIREACRRLGDHALAGCALYSSCEPCPMCLAAIYWARLDALYYAASRDAAAAAGFDDSFLYQQISLGVEARALPTHRALELEGAAPFAMWVANRERVPY
jgi:tRNA(Arg) A34 adenosine deaminase TadA